MDPPWRKGLFPKYKIELPGFKAIICLQTFRRSTPTMLRSCGDGAIYKWQFSIRECPKLTLCIFRWGLDTGFDNFHTEDCLYNVIKNKLFDLEAGSYYWAVTKVTPEVTQSQGLEYTGQYVYSMQYLMSSLPNFTALLVRNMKKWMGKSVFFTTREAGSSNEHKFVIIIAITRTIAPLPNCNCGHKS